MQGVLAFLAVDNHQIIGHIVAGIILASIAVSPSRQHQGIRSKLVPYGLEVLNSMGCPFVIVLGHPQYYPRFGFVKANKYKLQLPMKGGSR